MSSGAYTFSTTKPFVDVLDKVLEKYLPPQQHDQHVRQYRSIMYAYGSVAAWHRRMQELEDYACATKS